MGFLAYAVRLLLSELRPLVLLAFFAAFTVVGNDALYAQEGLIGRWRNYQSHRQGVAVSSRGSVVYGISRAGLATLDLVRYWYNEYTSLNGLSGGIPNKIYYDRGNDLIFISYESGLVDYFSDLDNIRSYRDIEQTANFSRKKVLDMTSNGRLVYFATEFGIVVFDVSTRETRFSYRKIGSSPQDQPVTAIGVLDGRLYAVVRDNGLFSASLSHPNLADGAAWQRESGLNALPDYKNLLLAVGSDRLHVSDGEKLYRRLKDSTNWSLLNDEEFNPTRINDITAEGPALAVLGSALTTDGEGNERNIPVLYYLKNGPWSRIEGYYSPVDIHLLEDQEQIAITDQIGGAFAVNMPGRFNYRNFTGALPNNLCQNITVSNRQLYVAPQGHNDFNTNSFNGDGIYYMNLRNREWRVLNRSNALPTDRLNGSFGVLESVSTRPEVYASSWDNGIIRLVDDRLDATFDTTNSCLTGIATSPTGKPLFIRPAGMKIDRNGDLWAVLNNASRPIVVLKHDGDCHSISPPAGVSANFIGLNIDENNYKWITVRRTGLLVYDDFGTPKDASDDRWARLRAGGGAGGLASDEVRVVKPDLQSSVWVGTTSGVSVFYNPGAVLNSSTPPDAVCPIYNFLCLLDGTEVTDIEIDGANQKWIGTANSGVFFFNADGTRQITQFNSSNSPLPSNRIQDIAIDQQSGEVFFATDEGIVSYQAVATEGASDNGGLEAYPNPVFLDDFEYVLIRGSASRSNIRIVSESGQLVRELTSEGGQTIWDGRDVQGKTVAPGIYFVLASLEDGEAPGRFKLAVLKRRN